MGRKSRLELMKARANIAREYDILLDYCVLEYNYICNTTCIEHMVVEKGKDGKYYAHNDHEEMNSIDALCAEMLYWLSCYYENGHSRKKEYYYERVHFLRFLEVFLPYTSSELKTWGIPHRKETEFIYR